MDENCKYNVLCLMPPITEGMFLNSSHLAPVIFNCVVLLELLKEGACNDRKSLSRSYISLSFSKIDQIFLSFF